jgi:putative ABC transport system substrate-binding protein
MAALGGAVAWPVMAPAQQPMVPTVGFINAGSPKGYGRALASFHKGLSEAGYVEGHNVAIQYRWAQGQYDRLPTFVTDLIDRGVSVIAATSTPAAFAAKAGTRTVPVVFTTSGDPVKLGLVSSLHSPGGNITGAPQLNVEVAPKRLELMHEIMPSANTMALLVNPTNPTAEAVSGSLQAAADAYGIKLLIVHAREDKEFEAVFVKIAQLDAAALVVGTDTFFNSHSEELALWAARAGVPTIYQYPEFTAAGGLMSYGGNVAESYRLAGIDVGRILGGEKPANLPVQEVTKVELIINLKTAKALALSIPLPLLGRADEVIE